MTAATITTIPALIKKSEIIASTKLTTKQAAIIESHDSPEILVHTRSGIFAYTTPSSISELQIWNDNSELSVADKATIKRAIAKMEEELDNDYRKFNAERNRMIENLQHAASWTDTVQPGIKVEMNYGKLEVSLTDLARPEQSWFTLDSVNIDAEVDLNEDGTAYTRYYDTADYRREWSIAGTIELAIEQAKTRLLARHAAKTADAYGRKINAEAKLAAEGIGW
jgi:hypothetical protein